MAESKVKRSNYISVPGFAIVDYGLKGNELLVYSIIHGFSQLDGQVFNGSVQYLADWTHTSKRTMYNTLQALVEKELLIKNEIFINNDREKRCEYVAVVPSEKTSLPSEKTSPGGGEKSSPGGGEKSSPNNIVSDTLASNTKKERKNNSNSYDAIIDSLVSNEELKKSIYEFIKMRKLIKKPLTDNALKLSIQKLQKLSSSVEEQIQIVDASVMNSWQGFFPLKKEGANNYGKSGSKQLYSRPVHENASGYKGTVVEL